MSRPSHVRRVAGSLVLLGALALASCGDGSRGTAPATTATQAATTTATAGAPAADPFATRLPATPGIRQTVLGRDASAVTILQPAAQRPGPRPVVVFLHGWGALSPRFYGAWLRHLVAAGNTVIYPRYQASFVAPPGEARGNVERALRHAFALTPPAPHTLVVAGHSAGGALSADYAADARHARLPEPIAIFAAYPGRALKHIPLSIPEVPLRRIPRTVRVVALGGAHDTTVGTREARRIGARGRFVLVTARGVDVHHGPLQTSAAARRTFWAPLDRLITAARRH